MQQELDAATEAGLDLNRMLSEVLTQKGGSDSLMESVERLQAQLDSQQRIIDDMNTSLVMKNQEVNFWFPEIFSVENFRSKKTQKGSIFFLR